MTPKEIVHELDKHIVGQAAAKRAVAVALRNRWRRQQVEEPLRQEITPAGTERHYLPFLRQLSAAIPGTDPFLRACFCVELFCERGLLRREIREDRKSVV